MKEQKFEVTGSKGSAGMAEFIINHIPECRRFYEGFGGTGIISEKLFKTDANIERIICTELNPNTHTKLRKRLGDFYPKVTIEKLDFLSYTTDVIQCDSSGHLYSDSIGPGCVFYLDPPYRMESRSHQRKYYGEFDWDETQHERFFELVAKLDRIGCKILISHYPDTIYDEQFKNWNHEDFQTRTRKSTVIERLYWNFNLEDHRLATTDFLGKDFTDRQRIKRKVQRMADKFWELPRHERQALQKAILKPKS